MPSEEWIPMADDPLVSQADIDKLLSEAAPAGAPLPDAKGARPPTAGQPPLDADIAPRDIDYLLTQAERALASVNAEHDGGLPPGLSSYRLEEFSSGSPAATATATLDLVRDVELDVKIELGRTQMYLEDVLKLRKGSVVPLDKLAGDPVDVYVNGRLVARGEVLVLNDNFCVRVAELIVGANVLV
jgi:flagellar motor switch protein FliN/FliY